MKLFRKLRYSLLEENRLTRYSIYALGEIVLVVIGILIALSINNWNERRKARAFEMTILTNILEDIRADRQDLELNLEYMKNSHLHEQRLLDYLMSAQDEPADSISYADVLGIDLLAVFHKASFNNLQSTNIGMISNNRLFKKITRFHDFYSTSLMIMENRHDYSNTYGRKLAYFEQYFRVVPRRDRILLSNDPTMDVWDQDLDRHAFEPRDLQGMKGDEGFQLLLSESLFVNTIKISFYEQILVKIKELSNAIEQELQVLRS